MVVHYTPAYFLNPQHKITVNLVGVGGTGSQVLTCLARMNQALLGLGHAGLHVRAFDSDQVTFANLGRQLFAEAEIGMNKAIAMINRTNRFFCTDWQAHPVKFSKSAVMVDHTQWNQANITISCVDTAAARLDIWGVIRDPKSPGFVHGHQQLFYWLDFGNSQRTGQIILGTVYPVEQPKKSKHTARKMLPTVKEMFNLKNIKEEDQGPSCSLAEAIRRQDLFINSTLAQLGVNLLWKLFREGMIVHQGCYLNLETMNVNPIAIK